MAGNVSPLIEEIQQLKKLESAIQMVSSSSKYPRIAIIPLRKEIVDRVAVLCREFLKEYNTIPCYDDDTRMEGTYADLYGMLQQVLEELRK